jgi:hypothetical protein
MTKEVPGRILGIVIVALIASGCFPYHFTDRPGVSGRVIDAETEAPIERADVTLQIKMSDEEIAAVSAPDGQFMIPAKQSWGIVIAPFDPLAHIWHVKIQAPGYEKYDERFVTSTTGPAMTELGPIRLRKAVSGERP